MEFSKNPRDEWITPSRGRKPKESRRDIEGNNSKREILRIRPDAPGIAVLLLIGN
jgi:hypothetical protein